MSAIVLWVINVLLIVGALLSIETTCAQEIFQLPPVYNAGQIPTVSLLTKPYLLPKIPEQNQRPKEQTNKKITIRPTGHLSKPTSGQPIKPSIHQTFKPTTVQKLNPIIGQVPKPSLGQVLKPSLGQVLKPSFGQVNKPSIGQVFKPSIGQVFKPSIGQVFKPSIGQVFKPSIGQVHKPSMGQVHKPSMGQVFKPFNVQSLVPKPPKRLHNFATFTMGNVNNVADRLVPPPPPKDIQESNFKMSSFENIDLKPNKIKLESVNVDNNSGSIHQPNEPKFNLEQNSNDNYIDENIQNQRSDASETASGFIMIRMNLPEESKETDHQSKYDDNGHSATREADEIFKVVLEMFPDFATKSRETNSEAGQHEDPSYSLGYSFVGRDFKHRRMDAFNEQFGYSHFTIATKDGLHHTANLFWDHYPPGIQVT